MLSDGSSVDLDLDSEIDISLNYQVFDVREISQKRGSYSKSVPIPSTPNNNKALGMIWDITSTNSVFDIGIKNKCLVFAEGEIVMRGYLQITGVKITSKSDSQGNQLFYYQGLVIDNALSFFDSLNQGFISDMNLSRFSHQLNVYNVLNSYQNDWTSGYYYFQPYKQINLGDNVFNPNESTPYNLYDYKPGTYSKIITNQFFSEAGYTYSGSCFNTSFYESLIIPWNGAALSADTSQYLFNAGFTTVVSSSTWNNAGITTQGGSILNPIKFNSVNLNPLGSYDGVVNFTNTAFFTGPEQYNANFKLELALESSELVYLYGQGFTGVDVTSVAFETQASFLEVSVNIYIGVSTLNATGGTISPSDIDTGKSVKYTNYYFQQLYYRPATQSTGIATFGIGTTKIADIPVTNILAQILQEEDEIIGVWVEASYKKGAGNSSNFWKSNGLSGFQLSSVPTLKFRFGYENGTDPLDSNFYNSPTPSNSVTGKYIDRITINFSEFLPKNIRKKDYFSSICQLMNLMIETDNSNDSNLYIDSRDVYYSDAGGSKILDWSDKLAINEEMNISFLTELNNAFKIDFTWADDSENDELLKLYKQNNNLTYGEYLVFINNQYLTETKTIMPIFAMTPTVNNNIYNQPVPFIDADAPKNVIRILSRAPDRIDNYPFNLRYYDVGAGQMVTNTFNFYSWAGEYDNPFKPSWSLNWGQNRDLYTNSIQYLTNNTLYNNYYSNYVNNISNGKVLKAKFYLTPRDISTLRLNSRIWLKYTNCYFVINKITNYNPTKPGLTVVELIKFEQ